MVFDTQICKYCQEVFFCAAAEEEEEEVEDIFFIFFIKMKRVFRKLSSFFFAWQFFFSLRTIKLVQIFVILIWMDIWIWRSSYWIGFSRKRRYNYWTKGGTHLTLFYFEFFFKHPTLPNACRKMTILDCVRTNDLHNELLIQQKDNKVGFVGACERVCVLISDKLLIYVHSLSPLSILFYGDLYSIRRSLHSIQQAVSLSLYFTLLLK